jgi:hypothetical protein
VQTTPEYLPWWTAHDEFLFQTPSADCCNNQSLAPYIVSVIHCCQFLVCSLPRYMRAYRPLVSCNNSPIVAVARLVVSADVSVAWRWIFPALGNSALQTTCHNI